MLVWTLLLSFPSSGQEVPSALSHEPAPEPVVITPAPVRGLQWDSTDEIFAYREKDTVLLRSSHAPYHHFGSVEMPGVLDFSLYHESDSGVQLIAGAADGTVAVWTVPTENTPPHIHPTHLRIRQARPRP